MGGADAAEGAAGSLARPAASRQCGQAFRAAPGGMGRPHCGQDAIGDLDLDIGEEGQHLARRVASFLPEGKTAIRYTRRCFKATLSYASWSRRAGLMLRDASGKRICRRPVEAAAARCAVVTSLSGGITSDLHAQRFCNPHASRARTRLGCSELI